ncbi:hypothetical protein B6E66_02880 [Streptomyces maremycinicus]|nr:hypothetical protein B6E66_02880 [Streptomyces sp. B9173]
MLTFMGSLFAELARQATANARREVETYVREIPELGSLELNSRARDETLDYAVWFRRRTIELAPENGRLTDEDLGYIASMGAARAGSGMSLDSRQRMLRVHTALMLREINEATETQRGGHVEELMRIMGWFAPQGERGIGAYREGFVTVMRRQVPWVAQVALLARSLLAEDPAAKELALVAGMELADTYAVTVIRVPDHPAGDRDLEDEIEALVKTYAVPATWCPARRPGGAERGGGGDRGAGDRGWDGELIVLVPGALGAPGPDVVPDLVPVRVPEPLPDPVTGLLRDFAEALGRPCAAGTAVAPLGELSRALDRARRISRAAPLRRASTRLRPHTLADVFVELAVADLPFVDAWLRTVARSLRPGPDLLVTLDAYYRHDMQRGSAATALNVHPRTLDYRLRRVRELTGIDPASTHGVRILSSVVTRSMSRAWT